jgi:hypothetical protein
VIRAAGNRPDEEYIERWVEFRLARQQLLTREDPPALEVILDEAVLHRGVGDAKVMRAQLDRLLEATEFPNVTIRVLPFAAGAHASPESPFVIIEMPEPYPDVACVDTRGGAVVVEAEGVESFTQAYDELRQSALSSQETTALIAATAKRIK